MTRLTVDFAESFDWLKGDSFPLGGVLVFHPAVFCFPARPASGNIGNGAVKNTPPSDFVSFLNS